MDKVPSEMSEEETLSSSEEECEEKTELRQKLTRAERVEKTYKGRFKGSRKREKLLLKGKVQKSPRRLVETRIFGLDKQNFVSHNCDGIKLRIKTSHYIPWISRGWKKCMNAVIFAVLPEEERGLRASLGLGNLLGKNSFGRDGGGVGCTLFQFVEIVELLLLNL